MTPHARSAWGASPPSTGAHAEVEEWVAVVDDHDSLRRSLGRTLALEGIYAVMFSSAEKYLDHVAPTPPSCLLLDLQLPGMSGHELAHFLDRARPSRPPIIFITGHRELLDSVSACCGAHGHLCKPFDGDTLIGLVRQALNATGARR
jgi:FixJ family two-component response regulator